MNRILMPLAILVLLLIVAVAALGLSLRAGDIRDVADESARRLATVHRLAGVGTGLVAILVHSMAATYFIGTSRWCREVAEAYRLDAEWLRRSQSLKRRTFPFAALGMLAAVALVASGGAADTAPVMRVQAPWGLTWTDVHFATAAVILAFTAYTFLVEWRNITANQVVIAQVMAAVGRIRTERGLDRA
jgi:hypothetical protein